MSDAALEIAELRAALAAQTASAEAAQARAEAAEAELAQARALASCTEAMIQELKLEIARLRRDKYGISSERRAHLHDPVGTTAGTVGRRLNHDVLDGGRLHGDDTTAPLLARGGTKTARLWTYVRDDRPWNGGAPPAALFHFSADRRKEHPTRHLAGWHGLLQSDVYGGYNDLYLADRSPGPVRSALYWSHAGRKFFELADIKAIARKGKKVAEEISPIALDAVTRIDAIFAVEREITGLSAAARHEVRQQRVAPLVNDLHDGMRAERARMSKHNPVAKAINYMLDGTGRWDAFTAFLDDGRLCLTTMPPSGPSEASRWAESRGFLQGPNVAVTGLPLCILSSLRQR